MRPMDWRRRTAGVLLGLCLVVVLGFPASQARAQPAKPAFHFPILPFRPVQQPAPAKPRPTLMPLVTGMPLAQARAILARLGLRSAEVSRAASAAPANWVIGQQPFPQQPVTSDSPIVLTVSDASLAQVPEPHRPQSAAQPPPRVAVYPPQETVAPPVQSSAAPKPPPVERPVAPTRAVTPAPVRPIPASAAPAARPPRIAPPFSAAPGQSSASSAAAGASQATPPESAPQGPTSPLGWVLAHPGWLAAIAGLAGAAAIYRALRRPSVPPAPVATVPVIVTTSMLAVPTSTIENAQPAAGPAIGLAWRIDPPQARLQYPADEEPSP